jgi:hypothetical protein
MRGPELSPDCALCAWCTQERKSAHLVEHEGDLVCERCLADLDADETFPADAAADLEALCDAQRAEAIAHQEAVAAERAVA